MSRRGALWLAAAVLLAVPPRAVAGDGTSPGDEAWLQEVAREIRRSEYEARMSPSSVIPGHPGGLQAPNRAQDLRIYFDAQGVVLVSRTTDAPRWSLRLALRDADPFARTPPAAEPIAAGAVVTYRRGPLRETWENTPAGIRVTIEMPASAGRTGKLGFDALTGLRAVVGHDGRRVAFLEDGRSQLRLSVVRASRGPTQLDVRLFVDVDALTIELEAPGPSREIRRQVAVRSRREPTLPWGIPLPDEAGDSDGDNDTFRVELILQGPAGDAEGFGASPTPDWLADGGVPGASFGAAIATAGDVNGDGHSDIIVGAPSYDGGLTGEGAAFVFHGSNAGLSLTPSWSIFGDQSGESLGASVAAAGDVNGDGYGDVIIGAPLHDTPTSAEGQASIFLGSAAGLDAAPAWQASGSQSFSQFGHAVATAGDVDGDGFDEVIVGAPGETLTLSNEGVVFVFSGGPSGPSVAPVWSVAGGQFGAGLGKAVAAAGDVNADGFDDVLVGAPDYGSGLSGVGIALLFPGSATGLSTVALWTRVGDEGFAEYGAALATAGDVNGDGYSDFLVGEPGFGGTVDLGRALLYLGSAAGPGDAASWTVTGSSLGSRLGESVATAGDIDGDGFADLLVGAPGFPTTAGDPGGGAAYLYLGSASGPSTTASWSVTSDVVAELGTAVAAAGDVDGDGHGDLLVGAPLFDGATAGEGRVLLYRGGAGEPEKQTELAGGQFGASQGVSVGSAGDVNGDGFSDVVVGAYLYDGGEPEEGQALLFLGSPDGIGLTPAWVSEGDEAGAFFGFSVAGAGDVNGDGYADVIVGAHEPGIFGGSDGGRAHIFLGDSAGLSALPAWSYEEPQAGANLGVSVGSAGDVNGDGYGDVIIGAHLHDGAHLDGGRALVFLGSAAGPGAAPDWSVEGTQTGARLGNAVAGAGDVDGDTFGDVIIGAYRHDVVSGDEGRAQLHLGSMAGLDPAPAWVLDGDQAGALLGFAVAGAGDVNGDTYSDLVIGALSHDDTEVDEGRVVLFLGGPAGPGAAPDWSATGGEAGAWFGNAVSAAGDVDNDGYGDLLIGARLFGGAADHGAAFLYRGSAAGPELAPSWTAQGAGSSEYFGFSVARAGDVNGDGYSDLLVGAIGDGGGAGSAHLYLGNGKGGPTRSPRQLRLDGSILPLFGLVDGGALRLQAGACSAAGRDTLRMVWEMKPAGTPFDGSDLFTGQGSVETGPGGTCSPFPLDEDAFATAGGTGNRWRLRTISRSPFFPWSTWLSLPDNASTEIDLRAPGCLDSDGDGFGKVGSTECPAGAAVDCDDADPTVFPGAVEVCDGVTNDCDEPGWPALVDPESDDDGDGLSECDADCDDADPARFPGNPEICDDIDNDCDDTVDGFVTACGVGACTAAGLCLAGVDSCAPGEPSAELCDGIDNDCDAVVDAFATTCGAGECRSDGFCDAGADSCLPGPPGTEICNGLDDDCDGAVPADESDEDGDGVRICAGDCDDGDASRYPGNPETCDNVDNDCDQVIDSYPTSCGVGECAGSGSCVAGVDSCVVGEPVPELCDALDNDCDGTADAFATLCGLGACAAAGFCSDGVDSCAAGTPTAELCDGIDNDCDGVTPADEVDGDGDGVRVCAADCDDADPARFPGNPELCDAVDNDCDGTVDGFGTSCGVGGCAAGGTCIAGIDDCLPGDPAAEVCDGVDNDCDGILAVDEDDLDADGVLECAGDCAPLDGDTYPGALETNDGRDNQCPGDFGFGSIDELDPSVMFTGNTEICWTAQPGASSYRVQRSGRPDEGEGCLALSVAADCAFDVQEPPVDAVFHYLVQAQAAYVGSLGRTSSGEERLNRCGGETSCSNGVDDDFDGFLDCNDVTDCYGVDNCTQAAFGFQDNAIDNLSSTAIESFFASVPVGADDYLYVFLSAAGPLPQFEWCSDSALFFRNSYLSLAAGGGSAVSSGQIWFAHDGGSWTAGQPDDFPNLYGSDCVGPDSWCSEIGLGGRGISFDPADTGDCEVFDQISGCLPDTFVAVIRIGVDRLAACGF